jgi:hypothetical protein
MELNTQIQLRADIYAEIHIHDEDAGYVAYICISEEFKVSTAYGTKVIC